MFPSELAPKLIALLRELARCADRFAAAAIRRAAHHEHLAVERTQVVKDFVAVEAMRAWAFFESADARLLDKRCRGVTYAALAKNGDQRLGRANLTPGDPTAWLGDLDSNLD